MEVETGSNELGKVQILFIDYSYKTYVLSIYHVSGNEKRWYFGLRC